MTIVHVPRESVNDHSVIIQHVLVESGSLVTQGQVICEIETSKTVIEVAAPEAGVVTHTLSNGKEIEVGAVLFDIADGMLLPASDLRNDEPSIQNDSLNTSEIMISPPLLSKAAAEYAQSRKISLNGFRACWVTRADLERGYPADTLSESRRINADSANQEPTIIVRDLPTLPYEEKSLTMRKRAEINSLVKAGHAETASTIAIKVTLPGSRLVAPDFLFKESITDLIIFEGSRLLVRYPELNAFYIDEKRIGYYKNINFGVSFDNVSNLKVLTIKDTNLLSLSELHLNFSKLLDLFESNQTISTEILGTSTVTISDLSSTSASFMLPLINGNQSLIIGVVKHSQRLFEIFATFDHRLSEGLRVSRFLEDLRKRVVSHYRDEEGRPNLYCEICKKSMRDELLLGNRGLLNLTLPTGDNVLMCRNCFEGR
jgi:pyruvate/2-oxoglutarate dehydrogenase complex dihydrolipoamide acyltransferase (E2) component